MSGASEHIGYSLELLLFATCSCNIDEFLVSTGVLCLTSKDVFDKIRVRQVGTSRTALSCLWASLQVETRKSFALTCAFSHYYFKFQYIFSRNHSTATFAVFQQCVSFPTHCAFTFALFLF